MASLRTLQRLAALLGLVWLAAGGGMLFLTVRMIQKIMGPTVTSFAGSVPLVITALACATFGLVALLNGFMLISPTRQKDRRCLWMTGVLFLLFPIGSLLAAATFAVLHKREVRERANRELKRSE